MHLTLSPQSRIRRARGLSCRRRFIRNAFTTVELMIVVTIISFLAALALPAFRRITMSAKASAVVNDLRVFTSAFAAQAQQAGTYPAEAAVGVMPAEMVGSSLGTTGWLRTTPIGGNYNWDNNRNHAGITPKAAVSINSNGGNLVSTDRALLTLIDRRIDDGDLTTGNFFLGANSEPVYIIER